MKNIKISIILSLFVILMAVFGNVCAQDSAEPGIIISGVVPDQMVMIVTKNFPADTDYTISMSSSDSPDGFVPVSTFNSRKGGVRNVNIPIPEKFYGMNLVLMELTDANGKVIKSSFINVPEAAKPAAETAEEKDGASIVLVNQNEETTDAAASIVEVSVPEEQPAAAEQPAPVEPLVCNFSIIPTVKINAVIRNVNVTFTTANFPANSSFSVAMGYYVSNWVPSRQPVPHHDPQKPGESGQGISTGTPVDTGNVVLYPLYPSEPGAPVPGFGPANKPGVPAPQPYGYTTTAFTGVQVGTFETGDGAPQTLTFDIPASLKGVNPIALWISDLGPCGFYSYNYFYNNSTN